MLYVTRSNDDSLGLVELGSDRRLPDFDLSPIRFSTANGGVGGHRLVSAYPNAIAVAPDNCRVYVAEAGINAVAVLDTSDAARPRLLGWIPSGWYPAALCVSSDGGTLTSPTQRGSGRT